ncbi:MAG: prepilin-type N-terminal cleavage/methylation domain-containing protein [Burkholderiaceae bacterium]|nr:prepilin-type N-terminal cleavage/methylation domain-containing protein [Microbacteriaceae bacterium]
MTTRTGVDRTSVDEERGFTLIELLVYMALSIIVLSLIGGVLISTIATSRSVAELNRATAASQLVASGIGSSVRNSVGTAVTAAGDTQLLVATRLGGQTTAQVSCQAWFYTAANGGAIYYRSQPTGAPYISIPSPTELASTGSGWIGAADGILPVDGGPVFSSPTVGTVGLRFTSDTPPGSPETITSTSSTSRNAAASPGACFR